MKSGRQEIAGGKPAPNEREKHWWEQVPVIVPGQEVFSMDQMRLLLGGLSESSYYEVRKQGLLKFSRRTKGGQVVHTLTQYREYLAYLNTDGVVMGQSEIEEYRSKKAASR